MRLIFLIGPPGAGKTACGHELARMLGMPFYDTDQLIESKTGLSIAQMFEDRGEAYFRAQEAELLAQIPEMQTIGGGIFATGGGLPIYNDNLARLEQLGTVVALTASVTVLAKRLTGDSQRPLLASASTGRSEADKLLSQRLSQLLAERSAVYEKAGYKIDTSGLKPAQVAQKIIEMLGMKVSN